MKIRDRIKEFRRIPVSQLRPNPKNWRTHPDSQKNVLKGMFSEIGYADALLAREKSDGSLELLDGHLRAETTPDQDVPVLILDLDDAEADKFLALFDPITNLAGEDTELLAELIASVETDNDAIKSMFDEMLSGPEEITVDDFDNQPVRDLDIPEVYQIIVECKGESQQQELFESLTTQGYSCKIMNL